MASLTIRIRPTKQEMTEMTLRRRQRSFFARLTQPLYRARMSKLMLIKWVGTRSAARRSAGCPIDGAPVRGFETSLPCRLRPASAGVFFVHEKSLATHGDVISCAARV